MKRQLLICALILLSFCPFGAATGADSAEAVFEEIGGQWIDRYLAEDLDGLMQLYTDDASVMLHEKPAMHGKSAIRAYFAAGMGKADVTFDIDVEEAEIHGDIAFLISKYWMTVTPRDGGDVIFDAGRSMLIYKRGADGAWKIHADIDQDTPDVSFENN